MNNSYILLFLLVILATIISVYYLLYISGFIPKTVPYFLRVYIKYLDTVECNNFKNISYLLKYFGYMENTISLDKISDIPEEEKQEPEEPEEREKYPRYNIKVDHSYEYNIYAKARKQFQKDYEKILSGLNTRKRIAILNERHREICSCKKSEYILF